jgi:hypothetical protein
MNRTKCTFVFAICFVVLCCSAITAAGKNRKPITHRQILAATNNVSQKVTNLTDQQKQQEDATRKAMADANKQLAATLAASENARAAEQTRNNGERDAARKFRRNIYIVGAVILGFLILAIAYLFFAKALPTISLRVPLGYCTVPGNFRAHAELSDGREVGYVKNDGDNRIHAFAVKYPATIRYGIFRTPAYLQRVAADAIIRDGKDNWRARNAGGSNEHYGHWEHQKGQAIRAA